MKNTFLLLLLILSTIGVHADKTYVSSASEINYGDWLAGDTIVMKNDTWSNQSILLKGVGTGCNRLYFWHRLQET